MSNYNKILTLEAQKQWEITKGNLRASVSIVGATYDSLPRHMRNEPLRYDVFKEKVEEFITEIQENEYFYPEDSA